MDNLEKQATQETRDEDKQCNNKIQTNNTECVLDHYAQASTNYVKHTGALLQTTGGKDELA